MNEAIQHFIDSKDIAILGTSPTKKKFGNTIFKELKKRGYKVYPVHPTAETIEGDDTYKDIDSLPPFVDTALVCMKPEKVSSIIEQLVDGNIRKVWFQQGADFSQYIEKVKAAGLEVVSKKCILMYAPPVSGIHAFHRFLAKLFHKL